MYVASGRNNPGAPSKTKRNATTAIVPITSRPVMTSFRCNCIEAAFQNRAFSAAAYKLSDHRILGLFEFFGFRFFNDFPLVQHSHSRSDAKGALHFVGDGDGGDLRFFAEANDQFVDDRGNDRVESGRG